MGNFSFGDYFKEGAIKLRVGPDHRGFWTRPRTSLGDGAHVGRPGRRALARPHRRAGQSHPAPRRGQLLGDGPDRTVRSEFGDLLRQGRAVRRRRGTGERRRGPIRRVLEPRLHAVRPQRSDGTLTELPKKNIDTGAGFERVLSILNGLESVFATDLFAPLLETASRAIDVELRRRRVDRRRDSSHRRTRSGHDHARRRRRTAVQRRSRLRAAPHHPTRHPRARAAPARSAPLASSLVDATIEKMGRRLSGAR